jgi:hypothetical protein
LYPEWRLRASHDHTIQPGEATPSVVVEWPDYLSDTLPDGLAIELVAEEVAQTIPWTEGAVADGYRRFVFDADPSGNKYTLVAHSGEERLLLWDEVSLDDPDDPPAWENLLSALSQEPAPDPVDQEPEPEEQAADDDATDDAALLLEPQADTEDSADDQTGSEQPEIPNGDLASRSPTWATTLHAINDLD